MTVYRRPDPIPLHRKAPASEFALRRVKSEKEDLHHLVARQIFSAVISGNYPEGSVLPTEHALAEELGVSRTALREAIKGLASKGMLETRRRRGTLVLGRGNWNMLDAEVLAWLRRDDNDAVSAQLWQTILTLLPPLAGLAAARGDLLTLRNSRLVAGNVSVEARLNFIVEIARAVGNRFILSIVGGALNNLHDSDSSFLETATAGLTPASASTISAAIEAYDGRAAEARLAAALTPRVIAVPA